MKTMMILAGTLALLGSGCAGVGPEALRADDVRACHGYGFERGTNAFAECLQRRDIVREVERRDRLRPGVYVGGLYGGYAF